MCTRTFGGFLPSETQPTTAPATSIDTSKTLMSPSPKSHSGQLEKQGIWRRPPKALILVPPKPKAASKMKAISKPSLSHGSKALQQVKTKSVRSTPHEFVALKSTAPRPDWSKQSSAVSTQRQKKLQAEAKARLKKYGSKKKGKANKTTTSVPKITAAVLSSGGETRARAFITHQGLEVSPPARNASEPCTSDGKETRDSCRPAFTAAATDETLTLLTRVSYSEGRLEASDKKTRAAPEDGVPLPARG